jgi:hypothetical protein
MSERKIEFMGGPLDGTIMDIEMCEGDAFLLACETEYMPRHKAAHVYLCCRDRATYEGLRAVEHGPANCG